MDGEGDVFKNAFSCEVFYSQSFLSAFEEYFWVFFGEFSSDHHFDDVFSVDIVDLEGSNVVAIPHYSDSVSDFV